MIGLEATAGRRYNDDRNQRSTVNLPASRGVLEVNTGPRPARRGSPAVSTPVSLSMRMRFPRRSRSPLRNCRDPSAQPAKSTLYQSGHHPSSALKSQVGTGEPGRLPEQRGVRAAPNCTCPRRMGAPTHGAPCAARGGQLDSTPAGNQCGEWTAARAMVSAAGSLGQATDPRSRRHPQLEAARPTEGACQEHR